MVGLFLSFYLIFRGMEKRGKEFFLHTHEHKCELECPWEN